MCEPWLRVGAGPYRNAQVERLFNLERVFSFIYGAVVGQRAQPLRGDAERNRQLLLDTAFALMARDGIDVSYKEIARAAGMGMGTIYRRFPERDDLIDALFGEHIDTVTRLAQECAADPDAWAGLARFLERQLELEAGHRGLGELLRGRVQSAALVRRARAQMSPLVADMIARGVRAGQLPATVTSADFTAVYLMVGHLMAVTRTSDPDFWRRALVIGLAGLRSADLSGPQPGDDVIDSLFNADRK